MELASCVAMISRRNRCCSSASGKIAVELAAEIEIVRHTRLHQLVVERELGVGEQHRKLGPRQRLRAPPTRGDLHVVGQELQGAVELARRLQRLHQPLLEAEVLESAPFGERDRQRLQIIVAQDERRHVLGHVGQQRIARLAREPAGAHRPRQRDLDVDLEVGGVHAGGVVDGIGVEPHPAQRRLDAAPLGHAKIGALADHLGADLRAGDANRVIAAVADRVVALRGRAHIGADAAEEDKIDRRLEDRPDHLVRGRLGHRKAERGARFGRKRNLLQRAGKHAATFGNERPIVVPPARTRQIEQAHPLAEAFIRIGSGVDENIAVVEGGEELDRARPQHAVAEDVARHVADADDGERRRADIDVHLAEVALD
jgi:hypothetical protein